MSKIILVLKLSLKNIQIDLPPSIDMYYTYKYLST